MFYSHYILARKGPLGTIWIAAHLEGKLRKSLVTETNISASVDSILFPAVPIALRLSGHLLLGVVRIYSRKVNYLYHDCSEALVKIKQAFHYSNVDLPPEASKVPFHLITLPQAFNLDELEASFKWDKAHTLSEECLDYHVSARDLITLQEQTQESHRSLFDPDERFLGSSDPYSLVDESNKEHANKSLCASSQVLFHQDIGVSDLEEDVLPPLPLDEEMELDKEEVIDQGISSPFPSTASRENGKSSLHRFHDMQDIPDIEKLRAAPQRKGPEPFLMELEKEEVPSSSTLKTSLNKQTLEELGPLDNKATPVLSEGPLDRGPSPIFNSEYDTYIENVDLLGDILGGRTPAFKVASSSREVPESAPQKRKHRKRRPIFDENPILSSKMMKKQLAGAGDLLRQRSKMPRTENRVQGFGMPSVPGLNAPIRDLYVHFAGLPSEEPSRSSLCNEQILTQGCDSRVREEPVPEFPIGDEDHLDSAGVPSSPGHSSPHNAQCISGNYAEGNGMDFLEQLLNVVGATDGQEKDICVAGIRRHSLDVGDTLLNANRPSESSGQGDDMPRHPVALATQSSFAGVNEVMPSFSPKLTCTSSRTLNVTAHGDHVLPKLDFLENEDNAFFPADSEPKDPFISEADTNSQRKERPSQSSYGWSVRTKFVAQYLKSIFEELEDTSGASQPVQVSLDSLLKGRSRKEAARLYFETLVLKSRDYIDVEQTTGFAKIMLSSTTLLRKDIL